MQSYCQVQLEHSIGEWEPEESQVLFNMIVDLWVTIRGFSYTCSWMENTNSGQKKTGTEIKRTEKEH